MRRLLVVAVFACSSRPTIPHYANFDALAAAVLDHNYRASPAEAVSLGLHEHDGELPDISPTGLEATVAALRADKAALEAVDATKLTETQREELGTLLQHVRGDLFDRVDRDVYRTNPMTYSGAIDLDAFVVRDYAPASQRAAAVAKLCTGLPAFLARARANLDTPVPKPWADTALLQTNGLADFVEHDVRQALGSQPALDTCKSALAEHAQWLKQKQDTATTEFALGAERFLQMLADGEGITIDLTALTEIARADLERNTKAIEDAAHEIDPNKSVAEVVAAVIADRPTPETVLAEATQQATEMRKFLVDHQIVSIPSDETCEVRPSPPFQRWNAAFMDGPGPFETKKLPSFYYISPPDPSWSKADQLAYIPSRGDLLFTTVHEVYPGHFIHALFIHKNPSRVLQALRSYSTSEGWAHYTEEMMYEAGAGGHTPQAHIGQLLEALLRNVRFVVAIGEHTGGMTVEQAEALFRDKGFLDNGNAHQQAVRGTFDPMFLAYTVGKLAIVKMRTDWMAKHPGATLGQFHDAFLSHGAAPLSVIRQAMLGDTKVL